jgi:imidazole glycerol-phosphate synthase subunit HisH
MINPTITIIDYGMGNLWSVISALDYLGYPSCVSSDPKKIINAESLILPGVGSYRKAMIALRKKGLDKAIIEAVQTRGINILGICLGMQLMSSHGSEDGSIEGLGLIPVEVEKFKANETNLNKIPHIGFDTVSSSSNSLLFNGLERLTDFYFVHSYRMLPIGLDGKVATCEYGIKFLAAYEKDNIFATQFHPEKSQTNGLILLKNFLIQ